MGKNLVTQLHHQKKNIRIVSRSGMQNAPEGVEVLTGDMYDADFALKACQGASVIYSVMSPPYHQWRDMFAKLQDNIIAGAKSADALLVVLENMYGYGDTNGKPLSEDLPLNATTKKGMVRAKLTQQLQREYESGDLKMVIARSSDFFGPEADMNSIFGSRAIGAALAGKPISLLFEPDQLHTYTYVPDVARALIVLSEQKKSYGKAWHIPSERTVSTKEMAEMVFQKIGNEPKVQVMPGFMFGVMKLFVPFFREFAEMRYQFENAFVVDHSRFEAEFGSLFTPTPLSDALDATIEWFRNRF